MRFRNPYNIKIKTIPVGDDFLFLITGGQAHIGAVSSAYWCDGEVKTQTQVFPGHREGEIATDLAKLTASTLQRNTTIVMGIHVDQATKEDIRDIIATVQCLMEQELCTIKMVLGQYNERMGLS